MAEEVVHLDCLFTKKFWVISNSALKMCVNNPNSELAFVTQWVRCFHITAVCPLRFGSKRFSVLNLWSKSWNPKFFTDKWSGIGSWELWIICSSTKSEPAFPNIANSFPCLVSDIWNAFIENCLMHYKTGENVVVDDQLSLTKTRRLFVPSVCSIYAYKVRWIRH